MDVRSQPARRRLGRSGPEVPALGLGTNNFGSRLDAAGAERVVNAALEMGVDFFDTADIYGGGDSERFLGRALRGRRNQALIASKFGMRMVGMDAELRRGSPDYVQKAVEGSLTRLGVEVIDLYQIHRPDPLTPISETLGALHQLVVAGKVRWIGISNFAAWQVADAQWTARSEDFTEITTSQDAYSLLERAPERDLIPALEHLGISLLPYSPLASGLLTGKYRRGQPAPAGSRLARSSHSDRLRDQAQFDRLEAIEGFAGKRGLDMVAVALGSLLVRPTVGSVIVGVMSPEQLAANLTAASWVPTAADLQELDEISAPTQGSS